MSAKWQSTGHHHLEMGRYSYFLSLQNLNLLLLNFKMQFYRLDYHLLCYFHLKLSVYCRWTISMWFNICIGNMTYFLVPEVVANCTRKLHVNIVESFMVLLSIIIRTVLRYVVLFTIVIKCDSRASRYCASFILNGLVVTLINDCRHRVVLKACRKSLFEGEDTTCGSFRTIYAINETLWLSSL